MCRITLAAHLVVVVFLCVPSLNAGESYQKLWSFGTISTSGLQPSAPVVQASDGLLYGTTENGGDLSQGNAGVVFRMAVDGTDYRVIHVFRRDGRDGMHPQGQLLLASDGFLYGTTTTGGAAGLGTVFRLQRDGSQYAVVGSFQSFDGARPVAGLTEASDGRIYGAASSGGPSDEGTVFRLTPDGSGIDFWLNLGTFPTNAAIPLGVLVEGQDGRLYGTSRKGGLGQGTVFSLDRDAMEIEEVHVFGSVAADGQFPMTGLVGDGTGGFLGTTTSGGAFGKGTVFRLAEGGSSYEVIHSFTGAPGEGSTPRGNLIRTAAGVLVGGLTDTVNTNGSAWFNMNVDGSGFAMVRPLGAQDGTHDNRVTGVTELADGTLILVAPEGGVGGGRLFAAGADGADYRQLRAFSNSLDQGYRPFYPAFSVRTRAMFGAVSGGEYLGGMLFRFQPDSTSYTIIRQFGGTQFDGLYPGGLMVGSDDLIYGTTSRGGTNGAGTLFAVSQDGLQYRALYSFPAQTALEAGTPATLMEASDGRVYATFAESLEAKAGFVFRVERDGSQFEIIHRFGQADTDPSGPGVGPLAEDGDGWFYGTTMRGGLLGMGTVYRVRSDGNSWATLWHFGANGNDEGYPVYGVLLRPDGWLYGTTTGGVNDGSYGSIFRLRIDGSEFATLKRFARDGLEGRRPITTLSVALDGLLYGTTSSGGFAEVGTLFRIHPSGANFRILRHFLGTLSGDGANPTCGLVHEADGALLGMTTDGGEVGNGSIFRINPQPEITEVRRNASGSVLIRAIGIPGKTYRLEASDVPSKGTWREAGLATASEAGCEFTDLGSASEMQFYRVAAP
ncbi:MAG: hypothetical protein KJ072_24775 [Verrucomicrobia bacterium]|nr:hypothetical protein [Verrucomicrobiota bacterium]